MDSLLSSKQIELSVVNDEDARRALTLQVGAPLVFKADVDLTLLFTTLVVFAVFADAALDDRASTRRIYLGSALILISLLCKGNYLRVLLLLLLEAFLSHCL